MEALIVAVGLYLVYVVLNRFEVSIDSVVNTSNTKAKGMEQDVNYKAAKKRAKLADKMLDEDMTVISNKDLDALLAGKVKDEKKGK